MCSRSISVRSCTAKTIQSDFKYKFKYALGLINTAPNLKSNRRNSFVDHCLKRTRNRLKVGYNFLATLPEAV